MFCFFRKGSALAALRHGRAACMKFFPGGGSAGFPPPAGEGSPLFMSAGARLRRAAKANGVSPSCPATRAQEAAALSLSPVGTAAGSRLVTAVTTEGRPSGNLPVRPTGIQEFSGRDQADFSGSGTLSAKVLPGHDHDCPGPGFILKKNAHFCMAARFRCPANTFGFSAGEPFRCPCFSP